MNCYLDIETIPGQKLYASFLDDAKNNFKAPSGLSKKQALVDMGLDGNTEPQKYWTKDDTVKTWEERMSPIMAESVAEDNWRKTSFDGGKGEVISIAWAVENDPVKAIYRKLEQSEEEMLASFFSIIKDHLKKHSNGRPPFFIGHHIRFDLKFLWQRAVVLGVVPSVTLPFSGRHDKDFYCTQEAWAGYGNRVSQNDLCENLGFEKKPDDIDGSKVWDFVKAGNEERVAEYNQYDVETVRKLHNRLNFRSYPIEVL